MRDKNTAWERHRTRLCIEAGLDPTSEEFPVLQVEEAMEQQLSRQVVHHSNPDPKESRITVNSLHEAASIAPYFPPPFPDATEHLIAPPFSAEELRFWQLYPRVPFDITTLNLLQGECLQVAIDFGWLTLHGTITTPTTDFLTRCKVQDNLLRDEAHHAQ